MCLQPPHREHRLQDENDDTDEQALRERDVPVNPKRDDRQDDEYRMGQVVRQRHPTERLERLKRFPLSYRDGEEAHICRREQFTRQPDRRRIGRVVVHAAPVMVPHDDSPKRNREHDTGDGRPFEPT